MWLLFSLMNSPEQRRSTADSCRSATANYHEVAVSAPARARALASPSACDGADDRPGARRNVRTRGVRSVRRARSLRERRYWRPCRRSKGSGGRPWRCADVRSKGRQALGAGSGRRVGLHPVRACAKSRGRGWSGRRLAAVDVHASANARTVLPGSRTSYIRRDGSQRETVWHARRWVCMQTISRAGSARRSVTGLLALAAGSARAENQGAARRAASCQRGGPAIPIWSSSPKPTPARNFRSRDARAGGGPRRR
jgi:hypothetical protein